jgi:hypothetical protein
MALVYSEYIRRIDLSRILDERFPSHHNALNLCPNRHPYHNRGKFYSAKAALAMRNFDCNRTLTHAVVS